MMSKAKLRYLRRSPRKVRLVCDVIRGMDALEAVDKLKFMANGAGRPVLKLLESAIANAENNHNLKKANLFIRELRVDEGPALKRWRARAFGRAATIKKRTSHISMILDEKAPTDKEHEIKKKKEVETKIVKTWEDVQEIERENRAGEEHEIAGNDNANNDENTGGVKKGKGHYKQLADADHKKKGKRGWKEKIFQRKSS